jgi:cytochrome c-type biogenesis protein CcmF
VGITAFAGGLRQWYVLTALSLAAFVLGSTLAEFRRGVSARRHMVHETTPRALVNLVGKNNRRYGGYIIHLGVILAFVGIVASSFFRVEVKKSVKQGQSFEVGPYELEYDGIQATKRLIWRPCARR